MNKDILLKSLFLLTLFVSTKILFLPIIFSPYCFFSSVGKVCGRPTKQSNAGVLITEAL